MKFWLFLAIACLTFAASPDLSKIQTIYLLPMSNGMDQYLANRLTSEGVLRVVTDPSQADAILTDRLGQSFEDKLAELYPPTKPETKPDAEKKPQSVLEAMGNSYKPQPSTFGRAPGNYFIVDRRTRNVLWSIYEPSKTRTADALNRTAAKVVHHLTQDLKGQAPH